MSADGLHYESPNQFTLKQRVLLVVLPPLIALALKLTFLWCRSFELRHRERFEALHHAGQPFLVAFWHESMALSAWSHYGMPAHTLTSFSFDGELAARVVAWFGIRAVRGSSSRGGVNALEQLQKALARDPMIGFTLDGPRGPRRKAKPGAAFIAARTGAVILPNAYAVSRAWRLKSWDHLPIPKPFARVICTYGEPIVVSEETTRASLMQTTRLVEETLNGLHREIELELGQTTVPE